MCKRQQHTLAYKIQMLNSINHMPMSAGTQPKKGKSMGQLSSLGQLRTVFEGNS